MPKFLVQGTYTQKGMEGLRSAGGASRREAVSAMAQSLGGTVEGFYFGFGEHDVYVVVDLPDLEAAAAVALTVGASGAVTLETTVLLTPEEVDTAIARTVDYRAPGAS